MAPTKTSFANCFGLLLMDCLPSKTMKGVIFLLLFVTHELNTAAAASIVARNNVKINVTIVSKSGTYLTINKAGITGETAYTPYAELELHSVGYKGDITIKGQKTGKYVAMNSAGIVSVETRETQETILVHLGPVPNRLFTLFRSKRYPSRYLAILSSGAVSSSTNSNNDNTKFALFRST